MYEVGTLILYSQTGVCKVDGIGAVPWQKNDERSYYKLHAVFSAGNEVIYIPVDTAVLMRPLINESKAFDYLEMFPQLTPKVFYGRTTGDLIAHYREMLAEGAIENNLLVIKEVHCKRKDLARRKKRLGQVDTQYLRVAERLVCEEFAVALQTTPESIRERLCAAMA